MDNDNSRNGVGGTKEQGSGKGGQEGEERRHHPRYTKARARQRYKKGKNALSPATTPNTGRKE
ncbi:hypothetical protein E2C01_017655 [Portunus trituberculatus]|uniref:Uncharacterized protein n=1 Tax=Portunus trituberculatus TaxID=210409 RepID=A0A5B7DT16_PORTR|nr:hypothetical protein [Portunus trituberculatus]